MLRDRLVCGVSHEGIQKKLLAEKNLTYETAFTLAHAIEAAERDSKNFKGGAQASQVVAKVVEHHLALLQVVLTLVRYPATVAEETT